MAEIGGSVVVEIVSKLVDAILGQACYSFCFNRYVRNLETQKENLQSKIENVVDRAKTVEKKTHKVANDVEQWLKEADSLIANVMELEEKAKKKKKTYCLKYFPNWIRRYSLAKQLEEKTNEIMKYNKTEFTEFSRLISLVGMNYFPSEGFVHFDSRKVAYDELLEALKDNQINMIGLYGMGGCGKTTLAKQVGKEAEKIFDKVVFVVVSNTIDVRKIQGGIASQLGLKLEEEDEEGRARRLFMGLSIGKRFLIILDDVWEELDFEAIGIPKDERQKGCIVLITTRRRHVCTLMECQIKIPLHVLNEMETLTLFHKHAKISDDNFENLKVLAQDIAKECGGLPVAIAAVASTLKEKHQSDWEEALETLRDSSWVDIEEGMRQTYSCLQLSYDYLNNVVAESLFLLCSTFPEDYKISEEDLTKLGIGLGLAGEVDSYKRARNRISIAKDKLIDSCLLQEAKGDKFFDKEINFVKMHDLVRDVALWIAKKKNKLIMGLETSQKALQENMIMKDDSVRYLWFHDVNKLPNQLDCPELEFLYISTHLKFYKGVKDDFFKGMKKLKVLCLKNIDMHVELLKSAHLINNIRCLILSTSSLGDISFIGSLEKLESLSLSDCSFDELPNSIIQQKDLRYLYLRGCHIQKNPYEVIGRCSQLEELYFYDNGGNNWVDQDENFAEFFDKNNATLVLERYIIKIGKDNHCFFEKQKNMNRCLFVEYFDTCISNATIMNLMQRAQVLRLGRIHSCKSVIPKVAQTIERDMNDLAKLSLFESNEIECVIDTSHHMFNIGIISNLTHLHITRMKGLKTVCYGQPPEGLFAKLEFLEIFFCDSLEHIIMDEVEEIFVDDSKYQRSQGSTFSKLKQLDIRGCNKLEHLFPASFAHCFIQLESLTIDEADKLKSVFGPFNNGDKNPNEFQVIEFSALEYLSLHRLPSLVAICRENYHPTWPSLQKVELYKCPQLNIMPITSSRLGQEDQIASEDLKKAIGTHMKTVQSLDVTQVNCGLEYVYLTSLPELRYIWTGPRNVLFLQNLTGFYISDCGNLKAIFPISISRSLPQLERLVIENCSELEEIVEEDNENQSASNPPLLFPHLTEIYISDCRKLKCVFPMTSSSRVLPKLNDLFIAEASQLEQLFGQKRQRNERMEDVNIPELEFLLLWKVPKLSIGGELIQLQTVKYRLVQQSPTLALTSTHTPIEMLNTYHQIKGYFPKLLVDANNSYKTEAASENKHTPSEIDLSETTDTDDLIHVAPSHEAIDLNETAEDTDDLIHVTPSHEACVKGSLNGCTVKSAKTLDIHHKETIEAAAEIEHLSSPINLFGFWVAPSLNETTKYTVAKVLGSEIHAAKSSSSIVPELINKQLPNPSTIDSLHKTPLDEANFKEPEDQGAQDENISEEKIDLNETMEDTVEVVQIDLNERMEDTVEEVPVLETPVAIASSSTDHKFINNKLPNPSANDLIHETPSHEANVKELKAQDAQEGNVSNEKALKEGTKDTVGEAEISSNEIHQCVKEIVEGLTLENPKAVTSSTLSEPSSSYLGPSVTSLTKSFPHSVKEVSTMENAKTLTSSLYSEPSSLLPGSLVTSLPMAISHGQVKAHRVETNINKDIGVNPKINLQDFEDDDLINLFQSMEENNDGQLLTPSVPIDTTTTDDDQVTKALTDLKDTLKMPLKDIATSESHSLRLRIALNFLSQFPLEDGAISHGLKATIDSLCLDLPSILRSSKQAFATINKFAVLEERDKYMKEELAQRKEAAIVIVSKMSKTKKFMEEAQEKEARLREKEIEYCEAELSFLQQQKKKCVAETTEVKKEFERVRKRKTEMVEDQRKARQQLLDVYYKWSVLCSEFEHNIDARDLS